MSASRILRITNGGEVDFYEPSAGGSSKVAVKAPALAADWTLTLPPDDGAAGTLLMTDGAGVTSWVSSVVGFDIVSLTSDDITLLDQGILRFREAVGGGTNVVALRAPAALAGDVAFILPGADGGADDVLVTDGSGNLSFKETLASLTITAFTTSGQVVLNGGSVAFRELLVNGTNVVQLQAPASLAGDISLTLPPTDGNADELLRTDGSGVMTWVAGVTAFDIDALTSDGITIFNQGELRLREAVGGGTEYIGFRAPAALAASSTYTWPAAPVAGSFLQTDAGGVLSWAASASTLQTAYDAGEDIVMIADTIDISQANNNTMLYLTKTGAGAGTVILIDNDGTGSCIRSVQDGAGYGLYHTQNGASYALVIEQAGASSGVYITQATANDVLQLVKTNAGAGTVLSIHNDGTGNDMSSAHGVWNMTAGGGLSTSGFRLIHDHLTVEAGVTAVTINNCYITVASHDVNPEFIDTINGGTDGQVLIIRLLTGSANITVRHNVGNIHLDGGANFGLDDPHDMLMLIYESTSGDWCEISRSNNA